MKSLLKRNYTYILAFTVPVFLLVLVYALREVYPFGKRNSTLDHNTVVSKGTIFASEEALLIFDPSDLNKNIRNVYTKYTHPLKLQFKGTGPW